MLLPRLPVLSALLVLLLAAGRCTTATLLKGSGSRADARVDGRSMMELVGRHHRTRTVPEISGHGARGPDRVQRGLDVQPRDPQHKAKFIKHLTGPLYFNPRCKKHFDRLYHNTRDCTIPAFFKRCARLLTRLANSPRCTER